MTIAEFLLARIAEDETVAQGMLARERPAPHRHVGAEADEWSNPDYREEGISVSPERMLAACEAKRRIVEIHQHRPADTRDPHDFGCVVCDDDRDYGVLGNGWCDTLRAIASEYADHPDYREEWRP